MTFDFTINLGTLLHGGAMLLAIGVVYGSLKRQMDEILRRLGCAEDEVSAHGEITNTISSRLTALEKDVEWIKKELEKR